MVQDHFWKNAFLNLDQFQGILGFSMGQNALKMG